MNLRRLTRPVFARLRNMTPPRLLRRFLDEVIHAYESWEDVFLTMHGRPRSARGVQSTSDAESTGHRYGIVLQGPLINANHFTLETVRIYRAHFPNAILIVSTWNGEDRWQLGAIRSAGAIVVLDEPPRNAGIGNINLQLISSLNGVRRACRDGVEYVLKTRTDQRIYAPNALPFLHGIMRTFPLQEAGSQRERLVACSLNTFKYRLYDISDMLLFGHIDDMLLYWGTDPDPREPQAARDPHSIQEWCHASVCEVYLATQFLRAVGRPPRWTLADSFRAYADHFCVVDREALDLYWPKYEPRREYRRLRYDGNFTDQVLTFRDWLLMYYRQLPAVPKSVLEKPFGTRIESCAA